MLFMERLPIVLFLRASLWALRLLQSQKDARLYQSGFENSQFLAVVHRLSATLMGHHVAKRKMGKTEIRSLECFLCPGRGC